LTYVRVRTIIGEPDPVLRSLVRAALEDLGVGAIQDAPSLAKAHQIMRREGAELLFLNMSADDSDASGLVTFDYIGPERRSAPRQGASSARQIDVPNPLAMLGAEGGAEGYAAARDHARLQLERERIVRLGAQLEWLTGNLSAPGVSEADRATGLLNIEWVGKELIGRIGASDEGERLRQLMAQSQKIRKSDQAVPAELLEKFHQAMKFIVRALPPAE